MALVTETDVGGRPRLVDASLNKVALVISHRRSECARDLFSIPDYGGEVHLFLDPYGMQVEWETIRSIASTQAIDLWVLFPLGMGMSRVLVKSGQIPDSWRQRVKSRGRST